MGRSLVGLLGLLGACGFSPRAPGTGSSAPDAPFGDGTGSGSACMPEIGSVCGGKLWFADFSVDPTTTDHNCDGVADFRIRQNQMLPGVLSSGIWAEPGTPPRFLDTQPDDPFVHRTIVNARMRNVQAGGAAGAHGAVVWSNNGFDGKNVGIVFVDLKLDAGGHQTASLFTKSSPGVEYIVTSVGPLDSGFHAIHLDIDPANQVVTFAVDAGAALDFNFEQIPAGGNTDEFATLVADSTSSEFDYVSIERCP